MSSHASVNAQEGVSCEAHRSAVSENGIYRTIASSNKDPGNHGVYHSFVSAWEQNNSTGNFSLSTAIRPPAS